MNYLLRSTVLLVCLVCPFSVASAETRLNLGVGLTTFIPTTPDGTHFQQAFAHDFDTLNVGGKVTYEYRWPEHWSLSAGYVYLGSVTASSDAVADDRYDPNRHVCLEGCTHTYIYTARDTMHGLESFGTYRAQVGEFEPFVTLGLAYIRHTVKNAGTGTTATGERGGTIHERFADNLLMVRGGAGVCYHWVCGDVTYYTGGNVNDAFPISTKVVLSTVYVSVPLTW